MIDNKDGTYTVTYVPLTAGMYTLLLKYGGKATPGFPAKVMVDPAVDTSRIQVFGPGVEGQGRVYLQTLCCSLWCIKHFSIKHFVTTVDIQSVFFLFLEWH